MPYSEIPRNSNRGCLLLAGLSLLSLTLLSNPPAGAQHLRATIDRQQEHAGSIETVASTYVHLTKVIVLKNGLREAPDSSNEAYLPVAPRLQSRIKRNSEFAAFVKLVRATSKRTYTTEELQKLYLSFKAWSYHNSSTDQ